LDLCPKLTKIMHMPVGHQFITLSIHLCVQHNTMDITQYIVWVCLWQLRLVSLC